MKTQKLIKYDSAVVIEKSDTHQVVQKIFIDTTNGSRDTTTVVEKDHYIRVPVPKEIREQDYGKLTVIFSILLFTAVAIYKRIKDKNNG